MSDGTRFRATFSARVVESFRGPWAPLGEPIHDPGIARDFVSYLEPSFGPTVVRVTVAGGSAADAESLAGDWLCDEEPVGDVRNARIRSPSLLSTWEESDDAVVVMGLAAGGPIDDRLLVLTACACVRTVLHLSPPEDPEPAEAVRAAEAWARGEGIGVSAVEFASEAASYVGSDVADAAYYAARLVHEVLFNRDDVIDTAETAAHEAEVAGSEYDPLWKRGAMADLVRRRVPTLALLRAWIERP